MRRICQMANARWQVNGLGRVNTENAFKGNLARNGGYWME